MSFLSIEFACFFLILHILLYAFRDYKKQNVILLLASYFFYAMADIRLLALLFGISITMWFLGKKIYETGNRVFLITGVLIDVITLGIFKYYNFFVGSIFKLAGNDYTALNIILPLGISFYIFQSISYIADIYMKKIDAEEDLVNVLLYIGFFPQITSGPIVKANYFLPQLKKERVFCWNNIGDGLQLFCIGAFKKVVIADHLAVAVDAVYATPAAYNSVSIIFAIIAYSLQIYFDFSGYSDMAIGVATTMGFELGKNFNLPYLAENPSDFWRRWHISLSSWFRDYVYFPLGGSRKGRFKTYFNLFVTMLLSGLWHGASWAFVFWGLLHAFLSVIHKMFCDITGKAKKGETKTTFSKILSIIVNYFCVTILWIPFRTNSMSDALYILRRAFCFSAGVNYINDFCIIFLILTLIIQTYALVKNNGNNPVKPLDLCLLRNKVIFIYFIIAAFIFAYIGNTAFIYAQF
ncbi:MBOAT family O-acyltransferase [Butyrivibrio sp. WCD2001]|uniref:MBOAT family O-acyltransferase n=1 Tax=Butyrivibrio sp. WCD2001 TaxID=1280681 RepID=UPI000416641D|nr:MBOAT family O-acyltransferase [Butyrivibrio sp. WCD2001]